MLYRRTEEQVSDIMRRVKSQDTAPELALRKALWAAGLRYRLRPAGLPGKPDIVLPRSRLAIFVDGDFWHGNQWRSRGHASLEAQFVASPKASYWVPKIDNNMRRDRRNTAALLARGWRVLRFWESDIKSNIDACLRVAMEATQTGAMTTRLARLPRQSAAVFGDDAGTIKTGLELAGWSVETTEELSYFSLAAAAFENGPELSAVLSRLADLAAVDRPPMVLLRLPRRAQSWLTGLLRDLNTLGYLCDLFTLDAEPRLYVLGVTDAPDSDALPAESPTRPRDLADFIAQHRDLGWFHWDVPPFDPGPEIDDTHAVEEAAIQWIADKCLNPLVNALIHGRCLSL